MRMIYADALAEAMGVKRLMIQSWEPDSAWGVPIVDAEPVVRCRECIEFVKYRSAKGGLCKNTGCCISEDFYCADGKRREEDK